MEECLREAGAGRPLFAHAKAEPTSEGQRDIAASEANLHRKCLISPGRYPEWAP
jgi:hypothetical protein